jgi:hypothetical protein
MATPLLHLAGVFAVISSTQANFASLLPHNYDDLKNDHSPKARKMGHSLTHSLINMQQNRLSHKAFRE